jgi:nicotinate-nucleotide--dimethylbenzimidazole phosphoribosyltransferase
MSFNLPKLCDLYDPALFSLLRGSIDNKTKPLGSLGRLEELAIQIGLILGTQKPVLIDPQLVVFAGDHGITAQRVSAYSSDVTWQMVENFLAGGAAVSVIAKKNGITVTVVDCGVNHDFLNIKSSGTRVNNRSGLIIKKVANGTADSSKEIAMTREQCVQAMGNGQEILKKLPGNTLLLGEMGIGNTSAAAMLLSRITGFEINLCTGVGTGLDDLALAHKITVLSKSLTLHANVTEPLEVLAAFGGFEIATMVGAVLEAAFERRVIVVDGFIASSAVLIAHALEPFVLQRCIFAHKSAELGHSLMLQYLDVEPLLNLDLRLGEGSGAAIAWPLLESACAVLCNMSSFSDAGVSTKL